MRKLFESSGHPLLNEPRYPNRPLKVLSNFVVEQMPSHLAQIKSGDNSVAALSQTAQLLVEGLSTDLVQGLLNRQGRNGPGGFAHDHTKDVAGLDVKMLELGIVHSGGSSPESLKRLVDQFAASTNQLPQLTYEEIIYINPEHDPRLFSNGDVALSEYDFYFGHKRIEHQFESVPHGLRYGTELLSGQNPNVEEATQVVQRARDNFVNTFAAVREMRQGMSPVHFNGFRAYLTTHPERGLNGPSGLFTPVIPQVDLLLGGENLDPEHVSSIRKLMPYYPRMSRYEIQSAFEIAEEGRSLNALGAKLGGPDQYPDLYTAFEGFQGQLKTFRDLHKGLVAYFIPQVLKGDEPGTGGQMNVNQMLTQRRETFHIR